VVVPTEAVIVLYWCDNQVGVIAYATNTSQEVGVIALLGVIAGKGMN